MQAFQKLDSSHIVHTHVTNHIIQLYITVELPWKERKSIQRREFYDKTPKNIKLIVTRDRELG